MLSNVVQKVHGNLPSFLRTDWQMALFLLIREGSLCPCQFGSRLGLSTDEAKKLLDMLCDELKFASKEKVPKEVLDQTGMGDHDIYSYSATSAGRKYIRLLEKDFNRLLRTDHNQESLIVLDRSS